MARRSIRPVLVVAALFVLSVVVFGVGGHPSAAQATRVSSPTEVIVQFSAGTSKAAMAAIASGNGVAVESTVAAGAGKAVSFAVYSSGSLSTEQLIERFKGQPGVVAVSANFVRSISLWPNDPRLSELWGMENNGQTGGTADADIDAATAWDAGQGSGTVVACIDTGVDYNHADLAANMWQNPGETPGDSIDNDGNGYVDDVYGIDSYAGDTDPMDEHGHGTHASGTMAAVGDNGVGVTGVAWRAKIMALRFLGPDGDGTDAAAIACINYAVDMKVNHGVNIVVINASWGGGGYNPVLLNAISSAASAGIVFCAAAGNSGLNNELWPFYPSSYSASNLIAVGSTTSTDARSSFSNYGATRVDLFAPGSSILSTYFGGYGLMSGTSMATPHVAGTVALLAALHPEDTVATRIDRILLSVDRVPALSGYCVTGGRLNAGSAVATATPAITSLTPTSGPAGGGTSVVITGSGFVGLTGASAVTFGGTAATSYRVDSSTQITATAPSHTAGTFAVRVTCPFGTSPDTGNDDFTFIPAPAISAVAPSQGSTAGGNTVVISGTNFTGASAVLFGSTAAAYEVITDARIDATAPGHVDGSVRVRVTTPGGTSPDTLADDYRYTDAPVIAAVAPAAGPAAGGSNVVITGGHFSGATAVSFGGTPAATFTVNSNSQITAVSPLHSVASVSISVTGPGGTSADTPADDYRFVAAPAISGVTPASGPSAGGTDVVIEGTGFVGLSGASAVTFGGLAATNLTIISETQISATTPPGTAGPMRVQVVAAGGTTPESPSAAFTYTSPPLASYEDGDARIAYNGAWAAFTTGSASSGGYSRANTGDSSAVITFVGDRLDWIAMKGTTTGKADVYLDGDLQTTIDLAAVAAAYQVNVWHTGLLHYGLHEVRIERSAANAAGKYITLDRVEVLGQLVYAVPSITSLSPAIGSTAGGSSVAISGTGFNEVTSVTFDGEAATTFTVASPTRITATAPSHTAGPVRVQVTAAGGTTSDTPYDDFTYAVPQPVTRTEALLTNPAFVRTGTWGAYSTASASGGSYLRSSTSGATFVIPFNGTQLDWIATKGTTTGKADVYLDNVFKTTVDLSSPAVIYHTKVWSTDILAPGYHTVKIVRSASNVSGKYVTVDAIDLAGTLLTASRKEETDPLLLWSPVFTSWPSGANASASGGGYKYINSAGAAITVKFTGVGLNLIARKASNYGKMRVTVDGITNYTVDLYSSATTYKTVWQSGFLAPGDHTVTITRLGTKNSSSTDYTIDLDAIDVLGVLR